MTTKEDIITWDESEPAITNYERGKIYGSLEELEKALKFGKNSFNFVALGYIEKRIKELKNK